MSDKNDLRQDLIERIHAIGSRTVACLTGGGSLFASDLLTVSGASRTLLAVHVPYSSAALCRYLKSKPEQFCSELTARKIAMAAWCESRELVEANARIELIAETGTSSAQTLGLGCTASLATDRPKRGAHRVHIAWQNLASTGSVSLELEKGARTRAEEERLVADLLINLLAERVGLNDRIPLDLKSNETLVRDEISAPTSWQQLHTGEIRVASSTTGESEKSSSRNTSPRLIFPGSFNPLHDGHHEMARIASELLKLPAEFEISVTNVDKPPLDFIEMRNRAAQFQSRTHFAADATLWFTHAPTFLEKSTLFPNATFIVGTDTILRIADPRYSANDVEKMLAGIQKITAAGCRFLVFGRTDEKSNSFVTLSQCKIPAELRAICTEVPAEQFRNDVSSTELRRESIVAEPN